MPDFASRNQVYGYGALLLSALIWGTEAIVVKLCYAGGFTLAALISLRYLVSLPVFALVAKQQRTALLPPRDLFKPLFFLSVNMVAGVVTLYMAINLLPATLAILFFYAYPSFTSLLHVVLKRGSLGGARLAALFISAVGLILLYWSSAAGISPLGVAAALLSAILQASKLFQMSVLLERLSTPCLNFVSSAATAVAVGVYYVAQSLLGSGFGLAGITMEGWIYMLILGMGVTVFANLFMTLGIHYVGAVDTSLVLLLEPLITALLALLIFGDRLSLWQLIGGFLIMLAVSLPAIVNFKGFSANESAKS